MTNYNHQFTLSQTKESPKDYLQIPDPATSNTNRQTQRDAMADQPEDIGICKVVYSCLWSPKYANNL